MRLRAFSIIELLVVIGVVAILLGLLLPAVGRARSAARLMQCQSNLRQIMLAVVNYTNDNNGYFPVAAPHELGGPKGIISESDLWLPPRMFGGTLAAELRPLNAYLQHVEVFRSPADRGEPLWWFDTQSYQATATCYELYGSSYHYASGYNRIGGVAMPMGIARCVGIEWQYPQVPRALSLGESFRLTSYAQPSRKVVIGSIPIHRTMTGLVAVNARAQWYRNDPDRLWANAAFVDGHVELVDVFPYGPVYPGVTTTPDPANPYY